MQENSPAQPTDTAFSMKQAHALAWAGIIPFALLSLAVISNYPLPLAGFSATGLLASYSLIIAVFLCGAQWGYHIGGTRPALNLLLISNVLTVALWFAWEALSTLGFLLLAALYFGLILLIDMVAGRGGRLPAAYLRLRAGVTGLVCLCLFTAWLGAFATGA